MRIFQSIQGMNGRVWGRFGVVAWPLVAAGLPVLAEPDRGGHTLAAVIPDDVYLCISAKHNPARDFLDAYWGEVFEALRESGIVSDLLGMAGFQPGSEEAADFERIKTRASELIDGVEWGDLCGTEMVYAERMPDQQRTGPSAMIPDVAVLFRNKPDTAERNFEGLSAIAEAIVKEINQLSAAEVVKFERVKGPGLYSCCLSVVGDPSSPPFSLNVGRRGNVIVATVGRNMYDDVLGLMDGKSAKRPLNADPRFQDAFGKLPPAADRLTFFNVKGLCRGVKRIIDIKSEAGDHYVNALLNDEVKRLNEKAMRAYRANDYPAALSIIQEAHQAAPNDSLVMYNLACFHALNGQTDEALNWLERSVEGGFYAPKQIRNDSDLKSLRTSERYQATLEKATRLAAEKRPPYKDPHLALAQRVLNRVTEVGELFDYIAEVQTTDGYATRTETLEVLADDARNNSLFPVVAKQAPIANYDRFLPEETTGFWISNGIDLSALHDIIEKTIRGADAEGEAVWAHWTALQENLGFNLKRDVLDWLRGDLAYVSVESEPGSSAWVVMIGVKDEAAAREKISSAMTFASSWLGELAKQNPMVGMLTFRVEPSTRRRLDGFHCIHRAMSPQPASVGIKDGWLFVSNREDAVAMCLATAAGEHPNVRRNEHLMAHALMPSDGVQSISFQDQRDLGADYAQATQIGSMALGMASMGIPNPEVQQMIGRLSAIVGKLGPVLRKIDFYKSNSSYTTFDGQAWHTRKITHYKTPAERTATAGKL